MVFGSGLGGYLWFLGQGLVATNGVWVRAWWSPMVFGSGLGGHQWCLGQGLVATNGVWVRAWWLPMAFGSGLGGHQWCLGQGLVGLGLGLSLVGLIHQLCSFWPCSLRVAQHGRRFDSRQKGALYLWLAKAEGQRMCGQ